MIIHRVVALVLPPQSTFELACVAEVFGVQRPGLPVSYRFEVCAEQPGIVSTMAGYDMAVTSGLHALETADTVVIPGWQRREQPAPPTVIDALQRAHRRGARIVAICSGAFLLAHTGLLDRRRATTHWRMAAEFAAQFPGVHVEADSLYIDHGDVATSAGTAAGIDLCLHLVRNDHGAAHANQIARHMVMPPHREGGQLQYAATPLTARTPVSVAPVLDWAAERLHEPLTVNDLAAQAKMSPRTLARRFTAQLGISPGQWLLQQRITAARALLEETELPVETIATRVGLSTATNLRRRFRTTVNTTPTAYRRSFGRGAST
ncbi:helix-turn-helix domain-containing protein [Micromonospora zamorensis]|uniref:helix-turn-helix domain-containing protein n=1 Tax=Micromonospora zamorensis TaxID=709883 RepID=UPI000820100F|nr:helix-turn-helix domain-containing protein [Micromonospora zamorensis]WSK47405.1 helix-turn-helix domain-containing protein [Micromonospora zamorensis]WTE89882.1 helix-turn-helix domain-containing protein [Micromonospora zamorensis]SCG40955.1 transcriptional regulator, AraC family with amidase-like domain [Micromonospora zamorensis]